MSSSSLSLQCIGHNMGAHHDRGTTGCASGYNYGFRGVTSSYRSILAYSCRTDQCDNNPYSGCTRLPFFSNPTLTFDGKDMGNSLTDNARVINENALYIAGQLPPAGPVVPTNPPTPPVSSVFYMSKVYIDRNHLFSSYQHIIYILTRPFCYIVSSFIKSTAHICTRTYKPTNHCKPYSLPYTTSKFYIK